MDFKTKSFSFPIEANAYIFINLFFLEKRKIPFSKVLCSSLVMSIINTSTRTNIFEIQKIKACFGLRDISKVSALLKSAFCFMG